MIFDMPSCGGCRTCEMACSFRHREEFIPAISSIEILDKKNEPGYLVSLLEKKRGERIACDGCKDLERPLCLQYCQKDKDLEKILKEFLATVEVKKNKRYK
jgi:Fe-S-cluster-containing hydrogenase component 2